ncbi:MAG: class I SAM-dependent methyltransferase [Candidatus Thiodiazotropha sp. (ex Monitilora ramsayi)]|nr:class I SAM-dependent methyltransferase [Candidatus Thiodiazotropha sp. (ex Monitilora ramsayi)]
MVMHRPEAYEIAAERVMMERFLPLERARVLELGCGAAWITRQFAERFPQSQFIATEVDEKQHEKNLSQPYPGNLTFHLGGAEAIHEPDESIDVVLMLKSLHHVPETLMSAAMQEIVRVLKPGGLAYFLEPVYSGEFNDLMRLIHDEKRVREQAFHAIRGVVDSGALSLKGEYFFNSPGCYENWEQFENRFIKITHTVLSIDVDRYDKIRQVFLSHMGSKGAEFLKPHRVDLLQKPTRRSHR